MWCCRICLFLLYLKIQFCFANLNLFVDSEDVQNLLGVTSQLWYVRNGTVNEYALGYVVVVPAEFNTLTFYWQTLGDLLIPYELDVSVANREAVSIPEVSIASNGVVPRILSPWRVNFTCTGRLTTQVDVYVRIKVALVPSLGDITILDIQRKKICFRDADNRDTVSVTVLETHHSSTILFVTLGCVIIFLVIVVIIACVSHARYGKIRAPSVVRTGAEGTGGVNPSSNNQCVARCKSVDSSSDGRPSLAATNAAVTTITTATSSPEFVDLQQVDISKKLKSLSIGEEKLQLLQLEVEGTFGRIFQAVLLPSHNDDANPVGAIVKTTADGCSETQKNLLLTEGLMLSGLSHDHLLCPLAVVLCPPRAPRIVFPTTAQGNLKKFLQHCHTLVTGEVVSMGLQVLHAIDFLHSQHRLHKDLATRNCFVDSNLRVLVGDNALARDLYPSDYHCLGDNENRPIKWMALEGLVHRVFSPASDVWSWGVLLWEVMTLGQQPYAEIDPFEMAAILRQGVRLAQPINCPDQLFKAMTFCWTTSPHERPTIDELIVYLSDFQQQLDNYV